MGDGGSPLSMVKNLLIPSQEKIQANLHITSYFGFSLTLNFYRLSFLAQKKV